MNEPVQRDQAQGQPAPSKPVHPVDEILPLPKLFALGLQHVLVMYANAVAVPLIIGGALHLPKDQMAMLINADLFACGIATLIQTVGFGPFGIRLPIIMGVTAVSISPMLAMTAMPGVGLTGIYGAVLVGGIFGLCVAPFVKYVLRFFPAVVTGTIITMIGVVLMRVGVNWAGGGAGKADFGAAGYLIVAGLVLRVDPSGDQIHPRLSAERRGADRHHRRLPGDDRARLDRLLRHRRRADRARRHAAAIRRAAILSDPVPDHVPRGDDRLHRGDRHVSGARRHDRPQGRGRRRQARAACRFARHHHRRDLQHVPLCLVFAEYRPGRRHRRL